MPALEEWSRTHHGEVDAPPVVLDGVPNAYVDELVMLGATIDSRLSFDETHRRRDLVGKGEKKEGRLAKALEPIQRSCARLFTGGYGVSALVALKVEAALPPVELLLDAALHRIGLRTLAAAPTHPLRARARLARVTLPKRHRSPLHRALHMFPATLPPTLAVETLLPEPVAP
ncbi:hypothetical protein JCM10449v2_006030 [Rhodotorula kratochvilovae]